MYNNYYILNSVVCLTIITIIGLANFVFFKYEIDEKYATPIVINTWKFEHATKRAWEVISVENKSATDAIEAGITVCELEQCGLTVGFGGSPDENGETTLDAMIVDGSNMNVGAVGGLRNIKNAISVARRVLDNTKHTLLAGNLATDFGINFGFINESLSTNQSSETWKKWKNDSCQPNFWEGVVPNPTKNCGPYKPGNLAGRKDSLNDDWIAKEHSHDTITMLAIDRFGNVVAGGSTNGLAHKIPGRVGDTPIPGAGAYADNTVGAASATGNGDIMMRFLPSFLAVEEMRRGSSPKVAAKVAINRIRVHYPDFYGAVIAINIHGEFGAACNGMDSFPFCVANSKLNKVRVYEITCL